MQASPLKTFKIFDLGVADANGDGHLDLFTSNHKYSSRLLLGNGDAGLTESRAALGISHTAAFPGLEDIHRAPDTSRPGVYLYVTDRKLRDPLHIDTTDVPASGRIVFTSRFPVVDSVHRAQVEVTQLPGGYAAFDFVAQADARIVLSVEHIDIPFTVTIGAPLVPQLVRVGADAVAAKELRFELALRDRHGYGFADFDSNGSPDLFIASGGLGGTSGHPAYAGRQSDELLMGSPAGYRARTAATGLVKGACAGRGVSVADLNGDGRLDLLESCEGAPPLVFGGNGNGGFHSLPSPPIAGDLFRVVNLDGGVRPELVAAVGRRLGVWTLRDTGWVRRQKLRGGNRAGSVQAFTVGDFDADGDPDLFAASPRGNLLLENRRGRLRGRRPGPLGLPRTGTAGAAFVDYDNDGDLDLDLVPQGLFRSAGGRFRGTGRLSYGRLRGGAIGYGTVSWPDLDEDGRRDRVSLRGRSEFSPEQRVGLHRNVTRGGHWLALDLVGPPGNRQAIGAEVMVRTPAGRSWGWVGQSETSAHSSGHHRVYFGLGRSKRIRGVTVSWPDGTETRVGRGPSDRLLRVGYGT